MAPSGEKQQRSRTGLILLLLVVLALAVEVVGWFDASDRHPPRATPSRMIAAVFDAMGAVWTGTSSQDEAPSPLAFRPLPYVNYGLTPNYTRRDPPLRTSNAEGFRGKAILSPKPEGRIRIVCLGGSTTYADAVTDEESYPSQLEAWLRRARPGEDIEVINAGVPSYTTAESLANFAFRCLDYEPTAIVIYHAANDYRPRVYKNFDGAYFHYRKVWDGTLGKRETDATLEEMRGGINTLIQHPTPQGNGNQRSNLQAAGTETYARNLTSIAGIAKAHGVLPVFVTFLADVENEYTTPEFLAGVSEHNAAMAEVAKAQGGILVDLPGSLDGTDLFHDVVHMNARGNERKAAVIGAALVEALW